jgi:hypothetical protein
MQSAQITLPPFSQISTQSAGLGWALGTHHESGLKTVGHTGAVRGSLSLLRLIPEHNIAYTVLMNGIRPCAPDAISRDIMGAALGILAKEPDLPEARAIKPKMANLAGCYESLDSLITIDVNDQCLQARVVYKIDPLPPQTLTLIPLQDHCFGTLTAAGDRQGNMVFVCESGSDDPSYLFTGGRLNKRLS